MPHTSIVCLLRVAIDLDQRHNSYLSRVYFQPVFLISVPNIIDTDKQTQPAAPTDDHARLQAILDATVDAIITIDARGIIESANNATARMFGYTESELVGRNISILMPKPYSEKHDRYLQRYLQTNTPHIIGIGREVTAKHRDGHTFPVDLAVSEVVIAGQTMFTGLIRDISARRDAEHRAQAHLEKLAHAGRLADLGLTTSTIAHEVNQPLTAIVGFANACLRLMNNNPVKTDRVRSALEQIASQGERASSIVKRIHTMARKQHSNFETVNVNDTVKGVLDLLATELRNGHVHIHLLLTQAPARVNADRIQIEQVLVNLLRNGIQAMAQTPAAERNMEIETSVADNQVRIRIHDSGPGLDDMSSKQIFESFYSTKETGMGVGLSISRTLIEAHNGRLWALTDSERGATFCLEIPSCE